MAYLNRVAKALLSSILAIQALPAFAADQVFLSGRVVKGGEVVTTFAAPVRLGAALPVVEQSVGTYQKDSISDGKKTRTVPGTYTTGFRIELIPKAVVGSNIIVAIDGESSELVGMGKIPVPGTNLAMEVPDLDHELFTRQIEAQSGDAQAFPFGRCAMAEGDPVDCDYELQYKAQILN